MSDASPAAESLPAALLLSRPVQVLGQMVTSVSLREGNGLDISEAGFPMRFGREGETSIDGKAMTRMIARLAGWPETSVQAMSFGDWSACAGIVAGFFTGGAAPSSS